MKTMHKKAVWAVGILAGAGAIIGLTYAATKAHASTAATPTLPPPPPPAPNTPSGQGLVAYTLPAQNGATTVAVPANGYVSLFLPPGGSWNSVTLQPSGASVPVNGNEAAEFQVTPVVGVIASATAVWTDSGGTQYTATISLPTS
jgi:hypothetical protein